jgi:hypothetical protein
VVVAPLRKRLGRLSAGMAQQRQAAQVEQVVRWRHQTRASNGRVQPTLAVGRAGVHVPLRHGAWTEGATATVSVLDRRGKRLQTVSLGQMPASGQTTLRTPSTARLQDILSPVDSASRRWVSRSEDGYHPSDYSHNPVQKMHAPKRSGRPLKGIRLVDSSPVCRYSKPLAKAGFGPLHHTIIPTLDTWHTLKRLV